jgi:hypothetical protein
MLRSRVISDLAVELIARHFTATARVPDQEQCRDDANDAGVFKREARPRGAPLANTSSALRKGAKSLRLEACKSGLHSSARAKPLRAFSA